LKFREAFSAGLLLLAPHNRTSRPTTHCS
jgi:hypothetical protein